MTAGADGRALVLGLGSRTATDAALVDRVMTETWHDALQDGYSGITVMQGTAEGADALFGAWAVAREPYGVGHLPVAADWDGPCAPECPAGHRRPRRDGATYCPTAGHRRNQQMADLGPLLALALILPCTRPGCRKPQPHDSHGTTDCLRRLTAAHIPVRRFP